MLVLIYHGHQHGVSIQIFVNLGKTFLRITRLRNIAIAVIWILARVFAYLSSFFFQILDLIYWTVFIFILIWRDTENQQGSRSDFSGIKAIYIVYGIESAAYGVLFTSCLCQKPERARYERVRAFDTNEWIKPRTKHFLCRELLITQNKRIFIELSFLNAN